jgi:DNA-binding XRE family transcriptional regulator
VQLLLRLKKKGRMRNFVIHEQPNELVNYLRVHRRSAGLTQEELGRVIGYRSQGPVTRHERFESVPPFLIALGYEILFQEPAGKIFIGLRQTMEFGIEGRLAEFEESLRTGAENGAYSPTTKQKLKWIEERRGTANK